MQHVELGGVVGSKVLGDVGEDDVELDCEELLVECVGEGFKGGEPLLYFEASHCSCGGGVIKSKGIVRQFSKC